MTISGLEKELLKVTGIKAGKRRNRQDVLQEVVRAVQDLPNPAYKGLTDQAQEWYAAGVAAMNKGRKVPEFENDDQPQEVEEPEAEPEDEPEEAEDEEPEDEEPEDESDEEPEDEPDEAEDEEPEDEPDEAAEDDDSGEAAEAPQQASIEEPEVIEPPPEKRKVGKAKAAKGKGVTAPKPQPKKVTLTPPYSGDKNRYGIYEGTQLDKACAMFEKGATQAEIKAALGDTKYNLIKRLIDEGHKVEKEGTRFFLTHKDDWAEGPHAQAKAKDKKK